MRLVYFDYQSLYYSVHKWSKLYMFIACCYVVAKIIEALKNNYRKLKVTISGVEVTISGVEVIMSGVEVTISERYREI